MCIYIYYYTLYSVGYLNQLMTGYRAPPGNHPRYMWLALPAFGFFLPSPMWHMKRQDC